MTVKITLGRNGAEIEIGDVPERWGSPGVWYWYTGTFDDKGRAIMSRDMDPATASQRWFHDVAGVDVDGSRVNGATPQERAKRRAQPRFVRFF